MRGRPPTIPTTQLGTAVAAARGARSQRQLDAELGVSRGAVGRIESGSHTPSLRTALILARWLGWTVEQVIEAADAPVSEGTELG